MSGICHKGRILINESLLNLDFTLLGGQSFRWQKYNGINGNEWRGVAYNSFWILKQTVDAINYEVHAAATLSTCKTQNADFFQNQLLQYFRINFDLFAHIEKWKLSHSHFMQIENKMNAVRVLDQEPLENILSFICSQNNHIKRISNMINWFSTKYGIKIGHFDGKDEFTFPTLEKLAQHQNELEDTLRAAKFGYRAKFIAQTVAKIIKNGGHTWLNKLRELPYESARSELVTLPGIGYKVADCICLMSLNHLEAVPIDTHIFQIAQNFYMTEQLAKIKTVTPKIYNEISKHFRDVYGEYAGWAQTVLFCSNLSQFKQNTENTDTKKMQNKKKRKY